MGGGGMTSHLQRAYETAGSHESMRKQLILSFGCEDRERYFRVQGLSGNISWNKQVGRGAGSSHSSLTAEHTISTLD